jgi:hypothetical protein
MTEETEYIKTTRARIIYRRVGSEYDWQKYGNFIPCYDSTDHFSFVCAKCKTPADVLTMDFTPHMKSPPKTKCSTLLFILKCPKCDTVGIRKIHLQYPHNTVTMQICYDGQNNRIYTINGNKPVACSQIIAENLEKLNDKGQPDNDTH